MSGAPHLPQKSDVGGFFALHFTQCFMSALPHFAQKLLVGGLFVPHLEQLIEVPPGEPRRLTLFITRSRAATSALRKDDRNTPHRRSEQ